MSSAPARSAGPTGAGTAAAIAFWVTLMCCLGGLLAYWATGFLNPEAGSGTGERLFLSLAPALALTLVIWLAMRSSPGASAIARLVILALGWLFFLVTSVL